MLACRYEKVEEAKKEMRKKAELEKRFEVDGAAAAGSDDSDVDDEDKIAEQEEAGKLLHDVYLPSCERKPATHECGHAAASAEQITEEHCEPLLQSLCFCSHPALLLRRLW